MKYNQLLCNPRHNRIRVELTTTCTTAPTPFQPLTHPAPPPDLLAVLAVVGSPCLLSLLVLVVGRPGFLLLLGALVDLLLLSLVGLGGVSNTHGGRGCPGVRGQRACHRMRCGSGRRLACVCDGCSIGRQVGLVLLSLRAGRGTGRHGHCIHQHTFTTSHSSMPTAGGQTGTVSAPTVSRASTPAQQVTVDSHCCCSSVSPPPRTTTPSHLVESAAGLFPEITAEPGCPFTFWYSL